MFDGIHSREFPFTQPPFHLCVELEFDSFESQTESVLEIVLIDDDGKDVLRIRGDMKLPVIPAGRPYRLLQDFKLEGIRFERAGTFRIDILHNGKLASDERLYITSDQKTTI